MKANAGPRHSLHSIFASSHVTWRSGKGDSGGVLVAEHAVMRLLVKQLRLSSLLLLLLLLLLQTISVNGTEDEGVAGVLGDSD